MLDAKMQTEEAIEDIMGFGLYSSTKKRNGWLFKIKETQKESAEKEATLLSGIDMYFLCEDDTSFKIRKIYPPYFYLYCKRPENISAVLKKEYMDKISACEKIEKIDTSLPNHLSGLKRSLLKVSFYNTHEMDLVAKELLHMIKQEKEENTIAIYEHDIEYTTRAMIGLDLRVGNWYTVSVENTVAEIEKRLHKDNASLLQEHLHLI